ncbi:bifunctional phosphopantothenoylcysteine decarboxylase/phosphopantothenate--cysteine ligase CoaBC [Helicobacter sp.]|uniref:bifunctional phosphopantothenoylcysteine decarboxylase/phosphopantothenate--cysteine ligase CoaBC n=1 Tax=Helicobacter sp. TaxID=218 RepID=UPI0025BF58D0|nr:bifunctional phosphopantothenoylcysteine decarboxylase/phosphopantothenate--cysteine ligase CoaBC [Helicobacter sp.]MCI5968510.1 bifunctional phosphopantothenoylcysteine decarboxylase/phosphopantothenate--cysteine ligase CoaBC [Helicobacter sp.]MDY2584719.1 bifunctional phosphopantothenoylcysteine decarboxylase/phosphopantothenate--cysteine ligase CoaBC [Helicobacter sp.]
MEQLNQTIQSLGQLLKDKKIALGVCGSVAIYKSLELIRILQKLGASVRVVMSKGAQDFIQPLLFEAISHHSVLTQNTQSWGEIPHNHIELATWADAFVIAPCSANTLNKIAYGIADNVLLESFLAFDKIKLIAPAANTKMLENKATMESLAILQQREMALIAPQCKELACQTIGNGALAEPLEIAYQILRAFYQNPFWKQACVCVSGGSSKESIDAVRYLSNDSSGKMGASIALAAYFLGAKVEFISSKFPFILPLEITIKKVESTQEYLKAIQQWQKLESKTQNFLFMSAAISDYIPKNQIKEKLKKQELGQVWNLSLIENQDILATLSKTQKTIGFKLESKDGIQNAKEALKNKGLDAICLNTITQEHNPLNANNNQLLWMSNTLTKDLGLCDKLSLAFKILEQAEHL